MKINLGKEFARYPAGRYQVDGPNSGERFRHEFLEPALKNDSNNIEIVLSDAIGLKSSFLEEAFGGLVRAGHNGAALLERLKFVSKDPTLPEEIREYIRKQTITCIQ
jgi:hypothetical protein